MGPLRITREMLSVLVFVIIAFVIRLALVPRNSVINGDGAYYTTLGERFVSGDFVGGISAYWSPLYSVLTGVSSLLFADREFAGRFISLIAGSLLIIPAYNLIREFYGRRSAVIGSVFLVFDPSLIRASGWAMTESLYCLVFVGFVLSGWKALNGDGSRSYIVTGLLFGISFLLKPEAVGYVFLMLALMVGLGLLRHNLRLRSLLANSLILLGSFSVFFLPYVVFVHSKTGTWTISQKIAVNLPAADFEGELFKILKSGRTTMKDKVWGDDYGPEDWAAATPPPAAIPPSESPGWISATIILSKRALYLLAWQVRHYLPALMPFPLLLVAIAGFFTKPWTRTRAIKDSYLLLFLITTLAGYSVSAIELRYLYPLIPLLIAWTAVGIVNLSEWATVSAHSLLKGGTWFKPVYFQMLATILLLASLIPLYVSYLTSDTIDNVPYEEKQAGLWLQEHSDTPNPTVMSANITVAFYARARHLYIPDEELSTIIEYARQRNTNYLVFSQRRMKDAAALVLRPDSEIPGLKEVYRDEQYPLHEIAIYKVER